MVYRVSCCNHSPHLNYPDLFKKLYILFLNIFTLVALTHSPVSLFHSFIVRWENAHFLMSSLHRSLAHAQLCPRVLFSVLYLKNMPLAKPSIQSVILKTSIWSPRTLSVFKVVLNVPFVLLVIAIWPFDHRYLSCWPFLFSSIRFNQMTIVILFVGQP